MNITERIESLERHIADGTLTRHEWTGEQNGRATACLLAALSPEAGAAESATACPADVMAPWLAYLTPWIDDSGCLERWPSVVERYAACARGWVDWTPEEWQRREWRVKRAILLCLPDTEARDVVARVVTLLDRAIAGDEPSRSEWAWAEAMAAALAKVASAAARAADWASDWEAAAAWEAAWAATWATRDTAAAEAEAAASAAARAADWASDWEAAAAWEAAWAATWATRDTAAAALAKAASEAARAAANAAWAAAAEEAWASDQIIDAILGELK